MLKIRTVQVGEDEFRVREPRLADFMRSRKLPGDEFIFAMLAGMLLDTEGKPIGEEAVSELPLRVFSVLAEVVNEMVAPSPDPLDQRQDSFTGLLSPSAGLPSVN